MTDPSLVPTAPHGSTDDMAAFLDRIEAREVERAVLDGDVDADYGLWLLDRLATRRAS